ncbi:HNH endonuclease [bacterium]|nr:HNH endonuclease [bacterium]
MKNKEIWKDIPEYEALYQVSNLGNIKSLDLIVIDKLGRKYVKKGKLLKQRIDKYGYNYVHLHKNGNEKYKLVHRLVAEAFIPNPNNLPQVNHKNEIKTDNNIENLEFCDVKYNLNYGTRNEKVSKNKSKKIKQLDKDGNLINIWLNSLEASKKLNIHSGNIRSCCRGELKTAGGYKWERL